MSVMNFNNKMTKSQSLRSEKNVSRSPKSKNVHLAPVENATRPGRLTNQLLYLEEQVLKEIWNHQLSSQLHFHLNPAHPAPHTNVTNPINLTIIKKRLKNLYYQHAAECVQDFLSVFLNCYAVNQPTANVVSQAKTLEAIFFKRLCMMPVPEFEINRKPVQTQKAADVSKDTPPKPVNKKPPTCPPKSNEVKAGVKRKANGTPTVPPLRISVGAGYKIINNSSGEKPAKIRKSNFQQKNGEAEPRAQPTKSQKTSPKAAAALIPPPFVIPLKKKTAQKVEAQPIVNGCEDPPKSKDLEAEKPQPPPTVSAVKHPQAWISLKNIKLQGNYENLPAKKPEKPLAPEKPKLAPQETEKERLCKEAPRKTERERLRREAQEHRRKMADLNAFDLTLQARIMAEFEETYILGKTRPVMS